MELYAYNPTNCPQHFGDGLVFPPKRYCVISPEQANAVRKAKLPIVLEGDVDFVPLWIVTNPK